MGLPTFRVGLLSSLGAPSQTHLWVCQNQINYTVNHHRQQQPLKYICFESGINSKHFVFINLMLETTEQESGMQKASKLSESHNQWWKHYRRPCWLKAGPVLVHPAVLQDSLSPTHILQPSAILKFSQVSVNACSLAGMGMSGQCVATLLSFWHLPTCQLYARKYLIAIRPYLHISMVLVRFRFVAQNKVEMLLKEQFLGGGILCSSGYCISYLIKLSRTYIRQLPVTASLLG